MASLNLEKEKVAERGSGGICSDISLDDDGEKHFFLHPPRQANDVKEMKKCDAILVFFSRQSRGKGKFMMKTLETFQFDFF